jgi:hypothetical protein
VRDGIDDQDRDEEDEVIASLKEHKMSFGPRPTTKHYSSAAAAAIVPTTKISNYVRVATLDSTSERYPSSPKARKILAYLDEENGDRPLSPKAKSISNYLDSVSSSIDSFAPSLVEEVVSFFDSSSTATKGRFRLNEPKDFDAKSLHLDNHPLSIGVSMLMGANLSSGIEKVVTVIFDKTMFTEAQAMKWWEENKQDPIFE